jgi:hypothetical protein
MEADWNERPQRTKRGLKEHRPFAIALLITCLLMGGLVYAGFFEPPKLAVAQPNQPSAASASPVVSRPVATKPSPAQSRNDTKAEIRWANEEYDHQISRLRAESAALATPEPVRQNVFNDANYVPSGSINTVSMAAPRQAQAAPSSAVANRGYVTVVQETKPSCWPYQAGSIECRGFKKSMKRAHNHSCLNSAHKYTQECRRAALYNPAQ